MRNYDLYAVWFATGKVDMRGRRYIECFMLWNLIFCVLTPVRVRPSLALSSERRLVQLYFETLHSKAFIGFIDMLCFVAVFFRLKKRIFWNSIKLIPDHLRTVIISCHCMFVCESMRPFLDAPSHLYMRLCPSVRPSVRRSVPCYFRRWKVRILGASCAVYPALFLSQRNVILSQRVVFYQIESLTSVHFFFTFFGFVS